MDCQRWLNRNSKIGDAVTYHFSLCSQEGDVRPAIQAVRCCRQDERTQVIHFHSRPWSLLAFPAPFTLETPPPLHTQSNLCAPTYLLPLSFPSSNFPIMWSKSFFSYLWVLGKVEGWLVAGLEHVGSAGSGFHRVQSCLPHPEGAWRNKRRRSNPGTLTTFYFLRVIIFLLTLAAWKPLNTSNTHS